MRVDSTRSNSRVDENRPDQKESTGSVEHSRFKKMLGKQKTKGKDQEEGELGEKDQQQLQEFVEKKVLEQQKESDAEAGQAKVESEVAKSDTQAAATQETTKTDFQTRVDQVAVQGTQGVAAQAAQATQEVEAVRGTPAIEAVADEIYLATNELGDQQLTVNLNSKTMDGLSFNIKKDAATGVLGVEFLSKTPEVTKLLEQNLAQVSQALAAKGLNIGEVRVQPVITGQQKSGFNFTGSNKPRSQGGRGR